MGKSLKMLNHTRSCDTLLVLVGVIFWGSCFANPSREDYGSIEFGSSEITRSSESEYDVVTSLRLKEQHFAYGTVGHYDGVFGVPFVKAEVGLYRSSGVGVTNTTNGTASETAWNVRVMAAGYEAAPVLGGVMGRASLADTDVRVGPGTLNMGLTLDTGGILNKNGLEVKVVGVGATIGPRKVELCAFLCIGFSW